MEADDNSLEKAHNLPAVRWYKSSKIFHLRNISSGSETVIQLKVSDEQTDSSNSSDRYISNIDHC